MSSSPSSTPDRPPLSSAAVARSVVAPGGVWREVRVADRVGSTNAELVAAARAGEAEGVALVADWQSAGRGRLGRTWSAPPGSALTFSVLLRPREVRAAAWAWLPLLAGVAVATTIGRLCALDARLKWPNDVLVGERKLAGILVERVDNGDGAAAVVGVGLNVSVTEPELPVATATSLVLAGGAVPGREVLLAAILHELADRYGAWRAAAGDPDATGLRGDYLGLSATVGRRVRAELPGGEVLEGHARDVDAHGRLVVAVGGGSRALAAADVVHVR